MQLVRIIGGQIHHCRPFTALQSSGRTDYGFPVINGHGFSGYTNTIYHNASYLCGGRCRHGNILHGSSDVAHILLIVHAFIGEGKGRLGLNLAVSCRACGELNGSAVAGYIYHQFITGYIIILCRFTILHDTLPVNLQPFGKGNMQLFITKLVCRQILLQGIA